MEMTVGHTNYKCLVIILICALDNNIKNTPIANARMSWLD